MLLILDIAISIGFLGNSLAIITWEQIGFWKVRPIDRIFQMLPVLRVAAGMTLLAAVFALPARADLLVVPETITVAGERSSPLARMLPLPANFIPGDRSSQIAIALNLSDSEEIKALKCTHRRHFKESV